MDYYIKVTEEQVEKAKQWKELADKYNLDVHEMRDLCYHFLAIRDLLNKKTT